MAMAGGPASPHWERKALQRNSLPLKEAENSVLLSPFLNVPGFLGAVLHAKLFHTIPLSLGPPGLTHCRA